MLTTHNKMLEAQITQQASFSSIPPNRLPTKPESNPREHCNCVTLQDRVEDPINPEDALFEKGRDINMAESKERNDSGKAATFIVNESSRDPHIFSTQTS